ncbi:MAG: TonB family protein [Hyphomonadaceae bacterium]
MRWAIAACALVLASAALAQTPLTPPANEIVEHFRAYRAALDAGDLATAETEAAAALEASAARDGDGGRTGILAMNLAQVRLDRGRAAEALEPARHAFAIASANGQSGLDPLVARLAVGRAETAANGQAGADALEASLIAAQGRDDLIQARHGATVALAGYYMDRGNYARAAQHWSAAYPLAAGSPGGERFGRAEARLGEGMSRGLHNMETESPLTIGTNIPRTRDYNASLEALSEAAQLAATLAYDGFEGELTAAQSVYAQSLAWRALLLIRLAPNDRAAFLAREEELDDGVEVAFTPRPGEAGRPICQMRLIQEPDVEYPTQARARASVGVVVLRFSLASNGAITERRTAVSLPGRWFSEAVDRVADQWRFEQAAGQSIHCVAPRTIFTPITFRIVDNIMRPN